MSSTTKIPESEIPVFDISLVSEELTPEAKAIMDKLQNSMVYISEYMPIEKYDKTIQVFVENMTYGFEHKEFRDCPITFKFRNDDEEEAKWLPFRMFIINMILWRPQMCLDPDNWNEYLIVPPNLASRVGPKFLKEYFDDNYVRKYNRFIPTCSYLSIEDIRGTLSEILGETTFIIQRTTQLFSNFFGLSSSIETFINLAKRIPEFQDLMNFRLDERKQPAEMEEDLAKAQQKAIDILINDDKFNQLKPLMAVKALNMNQYQDMSIVIGPKPDFDGRTIARPINTNFLNGGGFRDSVDLYINAISGRKAAMINNEFMGKSGHLLIMIAICTASVRLSKSTLDCNTVNPIPINIKTKTHLQKMDGRRYRYRGEKEYHILNAKTDEHLIGETLEFRSPITCACKDGCCRECYGELYYTNIDNEVAGIYSATIVMNPVVQGILSAKHHQHTNTAPIKFGGNFDDFFAISATDIILDLNDDLDATEYCLVIRREEIKLTDDEELEIDFEKKRRKRKKKSNDEDSDDFGGDDEEASLELTMKYYVTKFQVVRNLHTKGKTPEYYDFEDIDKKELFIHNDFIARMLPDEDQYGQYLYMEFEDINTEEFVFLVDVENNELTKPMKEIQKVLNHKDHVGCNTYDEMVNKMLDLMIASKLDATNVHAEMIIRSLVKKKGNILKRPDFSKIIMSNDVELLTIDIALRKNPAITTSLSTPYLKEQLINLTETFEKDAQSVFDPLFKPCLATDEDMDNYERRKQRGQISTIEL